MAFDFNFCYSKRLIDMNRRFRLIACIILFHFISPVFSQHIHFNRIDFKPEKYVKSLLGITQDQLGYIWISSKSGGIFRYDGREFVNFLHSDSLSNSLANNWTECILADSSGIIWIGTVGQGLDRFDPATNSFTHFRHDPKNNSSIANDTVMAILEDHLGNLWIGNYGGVDMLDRETGKFINYSHRPNDSSSLSNNMVRALYEDHQGTIWVACGSPFPNEGDPNEGGLNRFNRTNGNFTRYLHNPASPNSLATNKVKAMFEDSKGNFWIGTSGDGLHIMDREKGTFTHYYYDSAHPEKLSRPPVGGVPYDHITFINEDLGGGIWIGSLTSGINRYDPVTKKSTHFGAALKNVKAFIPDKIDTASGFIDFSPWQALFTKEGTIWISILLSINNSEKLLYSVNPFEKTIPFYPITKPGANTFYYDADSILWIGTDGGLVRKNLKINTEKLYVHDPKNANSLSHTGVTVIRVDKNGNFWFGTYSGLNKFDPRTNTFTRYLNDPKLKSSLGNDSIWSMCVDHNDNLWVGTSRGIDKLDKQHGLFTHYKPGGYQFVDRAYCMREDQDNELWLGMDIGLYHININNGMITKVLQKAFAKSVCVDSKNNIWIGADTSGATNEQRLYRLDRNLNKFLLFVDPNSRAHISDVFDIMEDGNRNLWVSTTSAIYKINKERNLLRIYGESSGVHSNGFGTGDNFQSRNGLLFFGDSRGYYSFIPDDLKENTQPRLNFTSFKLNGKDVLPAKEGILKEPVWNTKEIRLPFNQNSFSFEFLGINYQSPGEIKYMYKLENYDDDWHKYSTDRRAFYFGVPPGNYIFEVRAFNDDGGMSEKQIRVIILPPWWKTWWAYTLFSLLIIGGIWGFIYYRSQKLRKENRLLEEKVARRTNQLNQSLEELKVTQAQLIQSEKMASLGELTAGIAHEIQNPLNFVNNFSEVNTELIAEMKEEIDRGNMEEVKSLAGNIEENERKIIHHGKRADAIVKGMLQHSRKSTGQKEFTDLNALADEYLRLSYHGLRAKDKSLNADMQTDFDPAVVKVNLVPQDIGRVLLNLYNNAFYSVSEKKLQQPEGFKPMVSVSTKKMMDKVQIRIRDNGMGVPKKILDKIFQPFFTTKPAGSGTGLGLSLSYDIIKAHGGEMKVETNEGEGAEFILTLPLI